MKILFVHGYNSGSDSETGAALKNMYPKAKVIIPDFDLLNPKGTISKIKSIAKDENVDLIVGHSLGGFYTLACGVNTNKIVINPCMMPSIEIPKLGDVDENVLKTWENMESVIYDVDSEERAQVFGIFGDDDKLFSYGDLFTDSYYKSHMVIVSGGHKLPYSSYVNGMEMALHCFRMTNFDPAPIALNMALNYGKTLDESRLTENFKNIVMDRMNDKDAELLMKYGQTIYDILEAGYKEIGGLAGCKGPKDLYRDADFIKLNFKNSKLCAVSVYTFKRGGRKVQYASCIPTPEGKDALYQIIQDDIRLKDREAWVEVSGKLDHLYHKFGAEPIPLDIVKKLMADKLDTWIDIEDEDKAKALPDVEVENEDGTIEIRPGYEDPGEPDGDHESHYIRKIGPQYHKKIAMGNYPKNYDDIYKKIIADKKKKQQI